MAREGGVGEYGRPIDKDREYIGVEVELQGLENEVFICAFGANAPRTLPFENGTFSYCDEVATAIKEGSQGMLMLVLVL